MSKINKFFKKNGKLKSYERNRRCFSGENIKDRWRKKEP